MRWDDVSARNQRPATPAVEPGPPDEALPAASLTHPLPEAPKGHVQGPLQNELPRDLRPAAPRGARAGVRGALAGIPAGTCPVRAHTSGAGLLAAVVGLAICVGGQGARAQAADAGAPPLAAVGAPAPLSKKPLELHLSRTALAAALQQANPAPPPASGQLLPDLGLPPPPRFKATGPALAAAMDRLAAAILEAVGPGAVGGQGWNVGHPARLQQQALAPAQRDLLVHGVRDALMSTPVAALSPELLEVVKTHMLKEGLPVDQLDTLRLDELDTSLRDILVAKLLTWENDRPASFYAAVAGVVGFLAGTSYIAGTAPYQRLGLEPDVRIKLFDGGLALRGHGTWEPRMKNPRLELGLASRNSFRLDDVNLRSEVRLSASLTGPDMGRLHATGYVLGGSLETPAELLATTHALRSSFNMHFTADGRLSTVDGAAEMLRANSKLAVRATYDAGTRKFSPSLSYGYTRRTSDQALSVSANIGVDANGKVQGNVLAGLQF